MTPLLFTTVGLPKAKQLDAWRGWFDTVFDVEVEDPQEGFSATSESWNLGGFGLSRVRAPKLRAFRSPDLVRRNPVDHWSITVGHKRTFGEAGRRRTLDVPADTPFVTSLGRELESFREADDRLQLYLPRDTFPEVTAVLEGAEGRPISDAMGKLLAEFIALLARNVSSFSEADLPALQTSVRGMLLACIAPSSDHEVAGSLPIMLARKEVVRRIVDRNLSNNALGPDLLCREAGMSRSQLYRLLESEGGVRSYIQRRRLKQCFAELANGAGARSVGAIADGLGFPDPSSFSRSFRREFGVTPKDVMHAQPSGIPLGAGYGGQHDSDVRNLRGLLGLIAQS